MTTRGFTRAAVLAIVWLLACVSMTSAQKALPEEPGFQPNRDYLALQPWESIDTGSNNIILTFTDLVLPGNEGRQLRFDRVFSNQGPALPETPVGPQWRFGIAGVPMRVVEQPKPTAPLPPGNIQAERNTTPYFPMLDGSRLETTYVVPPIYTDDSTLNNVRTSNFWFFSRVTYTLSMSDGIRAQYCLPGAMPPCLQGYLVSLSDAFGNEVTLTWTRNPTPGMEEMFVDVEQSLGNGEIRQVHIDFDFNTELPTSLEYNNKTWSYEYYPGSTQLAEVIPPGGSAGGPNWRYEYATGFFDIGKVTKVTAPQGGVVEYTYANREFYGNGTPALFNVLATRHTDDQNGHPGDWIFEPVPGAVDASQTDVTLPSGATVSFVYGVSSSSNVLAGAWQLRSRTVRDSAGSVVEHEVRGFGGPELKAARVEEPWYVPEITQRLITRAGQTYTTEYAYGAIGSNFHNYHHPTTITERGPSGGIERTTALTYDHLLTPYRLALPKTEAVTIQGMTATRSWTYNTTTGFRTSETLYGITTDFTADALGNVAEATKENGKATSFTYSWGVLKDTITPGVIVERAINPDGTVASETMAGRNTSYTYDDPLGRVTLIQPPGNGVNPTKIAYNDANRTVTRQRGSSLLTTTTDGFGRPIEIVDGALAKTRTEYDAEGRKIYQSYPFTTTDVGTGILYDALGRVTVEENTGDQTTRTRGYDDTTNSVTIRDENNRATTLTYRAFGHPDDARLISVVDANQQAWSYSYDAIGNLTQIVTPTGHTRTWLRNTSGLVTSETHPESGTVLYTNYDAAGVLKNKVDANGTQFVFYHDDNDRVWRFYAGANRTDIVYEPGSDNRVSVTRVGSASTTFDYDTAGRLAHRRDVIGGFAFDSEYEYNGNDQMTAITYPSGRVVEYERNHPEGRITSVLENARTYASSLTYKPFGAVESYLAGNILTTLTYNPYRYWVESMNAGSLLQLNYGNYDGVGNVGTITDSRGPAWGQAFTYDPLHRLESAIGPWGPTDYAYDAHGNRQTTASSSYTYDPNTLRLTAQNGQPFGYDNNGNVTSGPGGTFTYTPENWLASVNSTQATYSYDSDGWRAKRTVTGDTTFYLRGPGGELLTEWHQLGANARVRDYVYADSRLLSAVDKPVTFPGCGSGSSPDGSPHVMTIASGGTGTFTFQGTACRRVSAVVTAAAMTTCLGTLKIFKPDGSQLGSAGGAGCAGAILEPLTLPVSGTYTVEVDPYQTSSGQVTVAVYDVVDVTGPMTLGQPQNAALSTPGQRGVWTFTGTTNQRIAAVITSAAMTSTLGTLTIYKPDGTQLAQDGGAGGAGMMIDPIVVLPTNGTYTVIVDPYKTVTGEISVAVYDVVDLTGSIAVNGPAVPGPLTTPGQRGLWTFDGIAGQQVRGVVDATTVPSCSYGGHKFKILKPDGTDLISKNGICAGSTVGPVTLPSTGVYTLVVDPYTSYTGYITVRVVSP